MAKTDAQERAARRAAAEYNTWLHKLRVAADNLGKKSRRKEVEKLDSHRANLEVYEHAVKVTVKATSHRKKYAGALRGKITEFSDRSRNRLIGFLNRIVWPSTPVHFVTLTYPDQFPDSHGQIAADLDVFSKRVQRAFPGVGIVWRRERVERKSGTSIGKVAPHYHFFAFHTAADTSEFWNFVRLAWTDIIFQHTDAKHYEVALIHGTHVRTVDNRRQAIYYVSKYMTKSAPSSPNLATGEIETAGRAWGYWGKIDASPLVVMALTHAQLISLRLILAQHLVNDNNMFGYKLAYAWRDWMGFTAYTDAVDFAQYFVLKHKLREVFT